MAGPLDRLVLDQVRAELARERIEDAPVSVDVAALHERLAANEAKREPYVDAEFVARLGRDRALRALEQLDAEREALERELAAAVPVDGGEFEVHEALELLDSGDAALQRAVVLAMVEAVVVSRAGRRGVPLAARTRVFSAGEQLPFVVPSRGRTAKLAAGVASA
jgi:hypothetical protein